MQEELHAHDGPVQANSREARKCAVILSAVIASLREAITESKDLYTSTGVSRGVSADVAESASKAQSDQLIGLLRLRFWVRKANQKLRSECVTFLCAVKIRC